MILDVYLAPRRVVVAGQLVSVRFDEAFAPIAADHWGGGDLPEHYVEACPRPLAKILAPDSWRVEASPGGPGQTLADPARPALRITPSVALALAHAGREGFALALDSPPPPPPASPPGPTSPASTTTT